MTIAIHQPNFLPWMGYFFKMSQADAFVFYDTAQYTQPSFIKRVKIHTNQGLDQEMYISIPLRKHKRLVPIRTLQMHQKIDWPSLIRAQLENAYKKAPFFDQLIPLIDRFFLHHPEDANFSRYTMEIIKYIASMLGIKTTYSKTSDMHFSTKSTEALIDITRAVGGDKYLSGMGAKKYLDEPLFKNADILLEYSDFLGHFDQLDFPNHFKNKSIVSFLAHFSIDDIKHQLSISK